MFAPFKPRQHCNACHREHRAIDLVGEFAPTHPGHFHVDRFALKHCASCDVVFLDPPPTPADLRAMYQESEQFADEVYTAPGRDEAVIEYLTTALRNWAMLPPAGARMLEVGAGLAWMCRAVKQLRPEVVTIAQDVTDEVAGACPWVDRYVVGPVEVAIDQGPDRVAYSLISLTHVIEHLVDPADMLRTLAGVLAPGGHLFITAPHRPKNWRRGDGSAAWHEYSYLHVPAHINYLSRTWFERVCAELGLALKSWDASHDGGQAFEVVITR